MLSIDTLSPRVPVRRPTLIGLDLPLTTLIDITRKRKQILTCTQEIAKAKLEWLWSGTLIHGDQMITTRHARALNKTKEPISLLASRLGMVKHVN
jgi:hypothetical protein